MDKGKIGARLGSLDIIDFLGRGSRRKLFHGGVAQMVVSGIRWCYVARHD